MSIEKITAKIISDAESQAKAMLDQANASKEAILAEAKEQADEILARSEETGRSDKEKVISRRKAVADIDGRKIVLEEKQKLIGACFDQAIESISSMKPKAYVEFLAGLIKSTGETEGELILNKKDQKAIGKKLVQAAAKVVPDSKITLAKETRDIRGGFLLKKGSVYINGTVEALVDEAREQLTGEVAARLFE